MMSKYSPSTLTSLLKKRFLRAAFLTLVMVSMTASSVSVMTSLAQQPGSKGKSQPTPAGESQSPAPGGDGTNWDLKIQQTPAGALQSSSDQQDVQEESGQIDAALTFRGGLAAYPMPDGRLEVFAVSTGGTIYHKYQVAPNSGWTAWKPLQGVSKYPGNSPEISVAPNQDGRLTIFVHGADDAVWFKYQTRRNDPESWSGWNTLGKPGGLGINQLYGAPGAALNDNGCIEVFAMDSLNLLNRRAQNVPNGSWGSWSLVSISAYDYSSVLDAALDNQGRISVFAKYQYFRQTAVGGASYDRFFMGLSNVAAEPNYDGFIGLVGVDSNWNLWYTKQDIFGGLGDLVRMGNGRTFYQPALVLDSFGRLTAFVHGTDNQTYWSRQSFAGMGLWEPWRNLGGGVVGDPAAAVNQDGRLEVFVLGTDSRIYHAYEFSPGGNWRGFGLLLP